MKSACIKCAVEGRDAVATIRLVPPQVAPVVVQIHADASQHYEIMAQIK
jgi:hypothetical protein